MAKALELLCSRVPFSRFEKSLSQVERGPSQTLQPLINALALEPVLSAGA